MEDRASEAEGNFEGWLAFLLKPLLISHQKVIFHFPALLCSLMCILCMPYPGALG